MTVSELSRKFYELLSIDEFSFDPSLNGLQVGDGTAPVRKVAFAVDACLESIRRASEAGADMLFVHHGLFWGRPVPVTGVHYARIKALIDTQTALFACHLPLDSHPVLGNSANLAAALGLREITPFAPWNGKPMGVYGSLEKTLDVQEFAGLLYRSGIRENSTNFIIPGGLSGCAGEMSAGLEKPGLEKIAGRRIKTVGIVSGDGADDISQALRLGLDAFVTGESAHKIFHDSVEGGINVFCVGHYETETFGVRAVQRYVENTLGLETVFIDIPTHL